MSKVGPNGIAVCKDETEGSFGVQRLRVLLSFFQISKLKLS